MPGESVGCTTFERRIVSPRDSSRASGEALFNAVLGEDFEPWSFAPCSSTTEVTSEIAYAEEVRDGEMLQSSIRKPSLGFDSDELSDILAAAAAAPPPPLRIFGHGAAMVNNICSWPLAQTTQHLARGSLAQRCKLAQTARWWPNSDDDKLANRLPSASFVRDTFSSSTNASASDTFHRRQSMPVKEQRACADVSLPAGDDDSLQLRQRILASFDRAHALGDGHDESA